MKMTTLKWFLPVLFVLGMAVACDKDLNMDGADTTSLRVSVTPAPGIISAAGTSFTAAVIVNQGQKLKFPGRCPWTTIRHGLRLRRQHWTEPYGTYGGDDASYTVAGIKVTVSPNNTGAKRMANLRFTVADNSSVIYTINQAQ